jgi:hypothetical protein
MSGRPGTHVLSVDKKEKRHMSCAERREGIKGKELMEKNPTIHDSRR